MLEWVVSISNFPEEVDLVFAREQGRANAVDRCIAPTFIVETSISIEEIKVVCIGL